MIKTDKEIAQAKADAYEKLQRLYDSIMALAEDMVPLCDRIEDYFFQDIDFQIFQGAISLWMADAGLRQNAVGIEFYTIR